MLGILTSWISAFGSVRYTGQLSGEPIIPLPLTLLLLSPLCSLNKAINESLLYKLLPSLPAVHRLFASALRFRPLKEVRLFQSCFQIKP